MKNCMCSSWPYALVLFQILDREAVEEVRKQREIPDIKPGYIVQLKVVNILLLLNYLILASED